MQEVVGAAVMELFVNIYQIYFILCSVCMHFCYFCLYYWSYSIEVNPALVYQLLIIPALNLLLWLVAYLLCFLL